MDKLDAWQQRYRFTAFVWAVLRKYSDDRGGYQCALITYYAFWSVFPLLLAAFTAATYILAGDQTAIGTVERHLGSYPIVGPAAKDLAGKSLKGSPIAIVVGVLGLLWGSQGLAQAVQFTMNEAWNVTNRDRPSYFSRMGMGMAWYVLFGVGMLTSTFIASLGSLLHWAGGPVLSTLLAAAFNGGLFLASFRILSPKIATTRQLLPGAIGAGVVWSILTGIGIGLTHKLAHVNDLYGSFSTVLGLLAFLYLAARLTIYAVEANVVHAYKLWPRSLNGTGPGEADREQLISMARREERANDQRVMVEF